MADLNKKILFGDRHPKHINEDMPPRNPVFNPVPPGDIFTFDRTDITFDSIIRTFDEAR